jgi:hypothetical protein
MNHEPEKCSHCIKAIHELEEIEAIARERELPDLAQAAQAAREQKRMSVKQRDLTRDITTALAPLLAGYIDGKTSRGEALSAWDHWGGTVEDFSSLTTDPTWTAKAPNLSRAMSVDEVLGLIFGHEILRRIPWRQRLQTIDEIATYRAIAEGLRRSMGESPRSASEILTDMESEYQARRTLN